MTSTWPPGSRRRSRPVPECSIRSPFQCSNAKREDESLNQMVPSRAIAALLHTRSGRPSIGSLTPTSSVIAPVSGSTRSSPR
jgi:hypothetical protein